MVVNVKARPMKRARRTTTAMTGDLPEISEFPTPDDARGVEGRPFRESVRAFLERHAISVPPPPVSSVFATKTTAAADPRLVAWRVTFRNDGESTAPPSRIADLEVIEEDVVRSRSIHCDHCRVVGWGSHPVCSKRYHFLIRNSGSAPSTDHQTCVRCGGRIHLFDLRCMECSGEVTEDGVEEAVRLKLHDPTHLLHGVIHVNGYGHLLRVNGREGGSKSFTGVQIMEFWDRMCKMLRVRKVSVMDVSKKHGMEYRLLHAVAAGRTWYGRWGYTFGNGSFALKAGDYEKAISTLSGIRLSNFAARTRSSPTRLQDTIALYQTLSPNKLQTIGELFGYVVHLLHEAHSPCSEERASPETFKNCFVTGADVENALKSIIKVLKASGGCRWITWRSLKGASFYTVKSPELLDYCLKDLGGRAIEDGQVVSVRCNPENNNVEYRLEESTPETLSSQRFCTPSADHLLRDLKFLYDALLNPATMEIWTPRSTRDLALSSAKMLLDCKQFISHYDHGSCGFVPSNPFKLFVPCQIVLEDHQNTNIAPPPEYVVLPLTATVRDLKRTATRAFQETYPALQTFQAKQLFDYSRVLDSTQVKLLLGTSGIARIKGSCFAGERGLAQFRAEKGDEAWTVLCDCGAMDDDGERMVACDMCGVWQHTRCVGIDDFDEVPEKYVCKRCNKGRKKFSRGKKRGSWGGIENIGKCRGGVLKMNVEAEHGSHENVYIV